MRRAIAVLVLLAATVGCGPDRAAELEQQIAQLQQERVERKAVDDARGEADAAEAAARTAAAELPALRTERAAMERGEAATRAALATEQTRTEQARRETADTRQRCRTVLADAEELEKQVQRARLRAGVARDQAAAFARELRPGDEAWATEHRLRSFSEFLARLAQEYPDDPVLARLAQQASGSTDPRAASGLASRARDRLMAVYGLGPDAVGTAPPETPPIAPGTGSR